MAESNTLISSPPDMSDPLIEIFEQQSLLDVDVAQLKTAVGYVIDRAQINDATINIAIVENQRIRQLNRQFLQHDHATDVLSFRLSADNEPLEGEIIVNAEMAIQESSAYRWTSHQELLLYAIHGALHLVGFDDATAAQRAVMRRQEHAVLCALGIDREAAVWGQHDVQEHGEAPS
jgi:probable rRNA maturation factor